MPQAADEFAASGIPLTAVIALLPFIAGLVTGIAVGFAGTAFPLVAGLAAASGGMSFALLALAFGAGYTGMMLSPLHLCLMMTRDYFNASYRRIFRHLLPCILTIAVTALLLFLLFRTVGW
jgi:hypothetical protein